MDLKYGSQWQNLLVLKIILIVKQNKSGCFTIWLLEQIMTVFVGLINIVCVIHVILSIDMLRRGINLVHELQPITNVGIRVLSSTHTTF